MSTRGAKRWHFDVRANGIFVLKGGRDLKDKSGKEVGPVKDISVPTTRSACQQAASFLNFAVQVSITGRDSQYTIIVRWLYRCHLLPQCLHRVCY